MIGNSDMDIISDKTDVLRILPEAAADLCTALFRNSPAGIYITRDGKFIYTNIEFRRITGYSQDELSGKDYLRLINPRYRNMPKQNMATLFTEEEENTSHEFKITTHAGKKKWISEKITYFKYGGNWLTLGHWLDISEPHSIEKAWREAERRFQLAFEDLSTGLAIIGTDGIFLKVNKAFCDMLAYDEKEILENRFDDVVCPEDREQCGDIMALFLSLEKPEIPAQRRLQAKDGRVVWTAMSISLVGDTESGPTYFIVHFQDITEQKRIEEGYKEDERLYRSLVDLSLEPLAVTDLEHHITHVSQKFIGLLDYATASDLLGKKIGSLVAAEESDNFQRNILEIVRNGKPDKLKASLLRNDGAVLTVTVNISWINSDKGVPACIVIQSGEISVPAPVSPEEKAAIELPAEEPAVPSVVASELSLALENTSTALILMNADTIIAAVNNAFEKMSGYSRTEVEGKKSWMEFVAKDDQARLKRYYLLRRLDPVSAPNTYEFKFVDRDGNLKDVLINITDVPGTKRLAATLLEVAEYKKAVQDAQDAAPAPVPENESPSNEITLPHLDDIPASIIVTDTKGIITYASPRAIKTMANGIASDMVGKSYLRFIRPGLVEEAGELFQRLFTTGQLDNIELELVRTDGQLSQSEMWAEVTRDADGELNGAVYLFKNITMRKSAEQARDESEKYYRLLAENSSDVVWIMDLNLHFTWVSPSSEKVTGRTMQEFKDSEFEDIMGPESIKLAFSTFEKALQDEKEGGLPPDRTYDLVLEFYRKDGSVYWLENKFRFIRDAEGKATGILGQARDITEKKAAEEEHQKTEKLYRLLAEHITDVVWIMDKDLNFLWMSDSSEKLRGFTNEETMAMALDKLIAPESFKETMELYEQILREEAEGKWPADHIYNLDIEMIHKNGSTIWTECKFQFIRDEQGQPTGFVGWGRDITERRKAQQDRDESDRYFRLLAENSSDVVAMSNMDLKLLWISPSIEQLSGYTAEEFKSLPPDKVGTSETMQKAFNIYMTATRHEEEGGLPHDAVSHLDMQLFHKDGHLFWVEGIFRFLRDKEGKAVSVLTQIRDISERKKAEETLEFSLTRLEKTVDGAIAAMATVIEMRDPYTAGHQERVAKISAAIAREMALPDDLVKGVEITGKIHDIGKIYVPMEILSKPGKLSPIERQIIQTHARGSYDILKSIDFPWPVAQTALQHHERLDGSGYPQGLKENEIMLEAKILMIADVVEAMASHRPYRASRGLEAALDEISNNSGSLYDADVVDACLRLFREKGFVLEETVVEP